MKTPDTETLIQELLDKSISEENRTLLEHRIATETTTRELYLQYVDLHCLLESATVAPPTVNEIIPIGKVIAIQQRKTLVRAAVASLAAAITLICTLYFVSIQPPSSVASMKVSPGSDFEIIAEESPPTSPINKLAEGAHVIINQGAVELSLASGVRAVIIGPANFSLTTTEHLFLPEGSAWFDVPKGAEGFVVQTNNLHIKDLGTQFGVIANTHTSDEVHVFKGKVEVSSLHDKEQRQALVAGEARSHTELNTLKTVSCSTGFFQTQLPTSRPYIHWSFDSKSISSTGAIQPNGLLQKRHKVTSQLISPHDSPPLSSGKFNTALALQRGAHVSSSWEGVSHDHPRSISYWIKAKKGHSFIQPIVGWGAQKSITDLDGNIFYSLMAKHNGKNVIGISAGRYWLCADQEIADSQWHHVCFVYHGSQTAPTPYTCYIDGTPVQLTLLPDDRIITDLQLDTATHSEGGSPVWAMKDLQEIRNSNDPQPVPSAPLPELDELYIFQGALTEAEVTGLYLHNSIAPSTNPFP